MLDTTVADYKRNLEGVSPDEARDEIENLERRLAAMEGKDVIAATVAAGASGTEGAAR
ncbi:MAG: hypothetical protein ABW003_09530 [Microvirga sp.]